MNRQPLPTTLVWVLLVAVLLPLGLRAEGPAMRPQSCLVVTSAADSGPGSLRDAIACATTGQTITFDAALAGQTITLASTLEIPVGKNLTIDGAGAAGVTVSGNNAVRVFLLRSTSVNPTSVVLRNLRIVNGFHTEYGAGIRSEHQGVMTIENCFFGNNNAEQGGSAVFSHFEGRTTIRNCQFEGNVSIAKNHERGSTVMLWGPHAHTVRNSTFTNNVGINGAGINGLNAGLLVEDCQFINNRTTDALYDTGQPNPFLRGFGAAIYTDRASPATPTTILGSIIIRRSRFEGNTGRGEGGACYLYTDATDDVLVEDCYFENNEVLALPGGGSGGSGGAIQHMNNERNRGFTLRNTTFANNRAGVVAGAVRVDWADTNISNCTFFNNRALLTTTATGGTAANGGALAFFNMSGSTVEITNSTFANNYAGWVGGAIAGPTSVRIRNNVFFQNTAGNGGNTWNIQQHASNNFTDLGGNIQFPDRANTLANNFNVSTTVTIANPLLNPLAANGGFAPTMSLQASSPAIDFGVTTGAPTTDQTGRVRTGNPDAGAVEYFVPPVPAVFNSATPKFTCGMTEAAIVATGAVKLSFGGSDYYIGTKQTTSINQDPIIAKFTGGVQDWCRDDYETTGADGRGLGLFWSGTDLYAIFTTDGTQGTVAEDFRRFTGSGWLTNYTDGSPGGGGGPKVSVIVKIDPANGDGIAGNGTFITARTSDNKTNSLAVKGISLNTAGNLVVRADSWFSPRKTDKTAMTQTGTGGSPHDYTIIFNPSLTTALCASAVGWDNGTGTDCNGATAPPAPTAPEIAVLDGTTNLVSGSATVAFGSTMIGTPIERTFIIQNSGTGTLTLTSPTLPAGFALAGTFPSSIGPGGSATFRISMPATAVGAFSGEVSFANNDADENPFRFNVTGGISALPAILPSLVLGSMIPNACQGNTTFQVPFSDVKGDADQFKVEATGSNPMPGFVATAYLPLGTSPMIVPGLPPTIVPGSYTFRLRVRNSRNGVESAGWYSFSLRVVMPVGQPAFSPNAPTARCRGAEAVFYQATVLNATSLRYTISPLEAGTITMSGLVRWDAAFSGTATITATALGCGGPRSTNLTVEVGGPAVGTPAFATGLTASRTGGPGSDTYTATAANATGPVRYSVEPADAGTMNAATGTITWNPVFSGTARIVATAEGCGGPKQGFFNVAVACPVISLPASDLPGAQLNVPYEAEIRASGGREPYQYMLISAPSWLTVNSSGQLRGTPNVPGQFNFTIRVSDANGCTVFSSFRIRVACPPVRITDLPTAVVAVQYSTTLRTVGGTGPYQYAMAPGSTLPAGFSLTPNGVLSGRANDPGSHTFSVRVTDQSNGCVGEQLLTLRISGCALVVAPLTLPTATAGAAYQQMLTASGGTAPFSFSIASGSLPAGLLLRANGEITGTPTRAGNFDFTIRLTDSSNPVCTETFRVSLQVGCLPITIGPGGLPNAQTGIGYGPIQIEAAGGLAPYTFQVTSGQLPAGLRLSAEGVLSGTTQQTGNFVFVVTATDSRGCTATRTYALNTICTLFIASPNMPTGVLGQSYSARVEVIGGLAPYDFQLHSGMLPDGLALTRTGNITGRPSRPGAFTFIVSVSDQTGCSGLGAVTIEITQTKCDGLTIGTTLPDPVVGQFYFHLLQAAGGTAPYTFSLVNGRVPDGLTVQASGVVSGQPARAGTYDFTIQTTDRNGCRATRSYRLTVSENCPGIVVSPVSIIGELPVRQRYFLTLSASGGRAPYSFRVSDGTLPAGLQLSPVGTISGEPLLAGSYMVTIEATDGQGCTGTRAYVFRVVDGTAGCALRFTPEILPQAQLNRVYNASIGLLNNGQPASGVITITHGTLPPGLVLTSDAIRGIPRQVGNFVFTLSAVTADGCRTARTFTLSVLNFGFFSTSSTTPTEEVALTAWPNPSAGKWSIAAQGVEDGALLEVFDMSGRKLLHQPLQVVSGAAQTEVRLPESAAGVYLLRLSHAGGMQTLRLVKQ